MSYNEQTQTPGMCPLSQYGIIQVQGKDSQKFLQGQLTCDLMTVVSQCASLAAFCNAKGRVIASMRLWQHDSDCYYLLLPRDNLNNCLQQLQKYAMFSKVTLSNHSEQCNIMGIISDEKQSTMIALDEQRYFYLGDETLHYQPITENQWDLLNIQSAQAHINHVISEKFTPHDLNYPQLGGVSFNKGCYVGQEVIARMEHLGKLKKHLYYCVADTAELPAAGSTVTQNSKSVGQLVNACIDNQAQCHALAVVNDQAANTGSLCLADSSISFTCHPL